MQTNDMVEKKIILIDGEELPGLVNVGELVMEKGSVEIPEFHRKRKLQDGIISLSPIEPIYKIARNTKTLKFLKDWFLLDEDHDVTIIRTDATGTEFSRTLLPNCESLKYTEPAWDASSPTYAQLAQTWLPWDIIPLDS